MRGVAFRRAEHEPLHNDLDHRHGMAAAPPWIRYPPVKRLAQHLIDALRPLGPAARIAALAGLEAGVKGGRP